MPCTKCEEGKYKWGETGECEYDSLDACESANHKYKMQPTPLGKTYEEYAKELKEYNLSSERFDFNDMKTLAKLLKEADKLDSSFRKIRSKVLDSQFSWEDEVDITKEGKVGYDASLDNITDVKNKNEKRLEDAAKLSKKAYLKYSDSAKKAEKLRAKFDKEHQTIMSMKGEMQSFGLKFRSAVTQVEKAAKGLGVDIPLDKFRSAIDKLDNLQQSYKAQDA
jgi:hypothetical protein